MIDFPLRSKLYIRTGLFLSVISLYIFNPSLLRSIMTFGSSIKVYHLLWLYLMYEMALKIIPPLNHHVASGKHLKKHYNPTPTINQEKLSAYTHTMNKGMLKMVIFWLVCNSIIFYTIWQLPHKEHLYFLLFLFYYMCDMWCANVFCVFQAFLMHNRCCTVCRIYNYDQFMYCMPLLLIPSWYTYTLAGFALLALLQWEYLHYKYPERFSTLTNKNLQCKYCKEKRCKKIKKTPYLMR